MRAKPVLRPPPKCVLKPKVTTRDLSVLYIVASFSARSALETFARDGWRTSTTIWRRWSRRLVMNLRVRKVTGASDCMNRPKRSANDQSSDVSSNNPTCPQASKGPNPWTRRPRHRERWLDLPWSMIFYLPRARQARYYRREF